MMPHSPTSQLARAPRAPVPARSDWPSLLYLGGFALNTGTLALLPAHPLMGLQCLLQGFFFVGLLEMTHQCVHHAFIASSRKANEAVGLLAAALIGFNLVTYRHFHLEHHRHTSDADDPEGHLYADSPDTRWLMLVAPIAHVYVVLGIHRLAGRYVPRRERAAWLRSQCVTLGVLLALVAWAVLSPWSFLRTYLLPLCLFAWLDFLFSQAEHYEAPIRDRGVRCNVAEVSYDVWVPAFLSALMLQRNLHRVHHVWPRTRWFEAPRRLRELDSLQPGRVLTFAEFARRWWRLGPRTWNASPASRLGPSLAAAFCDAPDYSFILAHHRDKVRALSWFFGHFAARLAQRLGAIHTSADGEAGILTFAPGRSPSLLMLLSAGVLSFPLRFGWRGTWRAFSLGLTMEQERLALAPMPHWYVVAVGVAPARQGQGLGHDLLTQTLACADAEGVPCYLEAFERPLVEHYMRRGFQVLGEQTLSSGLHLWCLLRLPRK